MSHVIKYDRSSHSNEPHKMIEALSYLNVPIAFFNEETAKRLHTVCYTLITNMNVMVILGFI